MHPARCPGAALLKKLILVTLAISLTTTMAMAAGAPSQVKTATPTQPQIKQASPAPVMATLSQELDREMPILSKASPAAYFLGYTVTSTERSEVVGSNGALLSSEQNLSRWLETQVRVGSYDLDNTHKVGNSQPSVGSYGTAVPVDNDAPVLRRSMWLETQKQYRAASEALIKISTSKEVQVQTTEEHAPDFSREPAH